MFPLNPIAAEFGSNYDILLAISSTDDQFSNKVATEISNKYECKEFTDSEQGGSSESLKRPPGLETLGT